MYTDLAGQLKALRVDQEGAPKIQTAPVHQGDEASSVINAALQVINSAAVNSAAVKSAPVTEDVPTVTEDVHGSSKQHFEGLFQAL